MKRPGTSECDKPEKNGLQQIILECNMKVFILMHEV